MTAAFYLVSCQALGSEEYEFDPIFLQGGMAAGELGKFARGDFIAPGKYLVDIQLNGVSIGRDEVEFRAPSAQGSAKPCLTVGILDRAGVDLLQLPGVDVANRQTCVDLPTAIASASVSYDSSEQQLILAVPQANLRRSVRGYVDPSQWDSGVTAGMLNYNYGSFYSNTQQNGTQSYLGLDAGLNLGDWHFRSRSNLDWNGETRRWQNRALYVQREITPWRSQLTVGDLSTSGNLFDTFSLRGLQLASDDSMLPDSLTGYAPVVRGQANSNARVTVRQNGYVVYETTVAPGPFEITDLYPSGYGGDLQVTVSEADGQVRRFSVPYASVVRMLRPGANRYSAAFGQYRNGYQDSSRRMVGQLTYEQGLNNLLTGYTGLLAAEGYTSPMVGMAMNTSIGAFGLDVTHASTRVGADGESGSGTSNGQSARLSYSKTLPQTGSSVSVAAYRYSTSGFYSLPDAMRAMDTDRVERRWKQDDWRDADLTRPFEPRFRENQSLARQRSTMSFTVNQSLGDWGSLYASGRVSDYWNQSGNSTQYQLGYNGNTRYFSYTVNASRSTDRSGERDDQVAISLSIPLGGRNTASSDVTFNQRGNSVNTRLNGTAGSAEEYNWGISAGRSESGTRSAGFNGSYQGSMGRLNVATQNGDGFRQVSWGATGSVVAHPGGVTLGQTVSDTFAIVEAPGAAGASLSSQAGAKVDSRGYAILPYLTPYRRNSVEIDPRGMSDDVELKSTTDEVVPRAGAVVVSRFETVTGRMVVIDLQLPPGLKVPFGTEVKTEAGSVTGVVGQGARVMARGLEDSGILLIKWGETTAEQCRVTYALPPAKTASSRFEHFNAACNPQGAQGSLVARQSR